jgi:hypothetical protein
MPLSFSCGHWLEALSPTIFRHCERSEAIHLRLWIAAALRASQ